MPTPVDTADTAGEPRWLALRDLKRPNAKRPAYVELAERGVRVYTPMKTEVTTVRGRQRLVSHPVIRDLLFAFDTRERLDPVVEAIPTLQYRYAKGLPHRQPITVPTADMERFIAVTTQGAESCTYYSAEELSQHMIGERIRILGGALAGMEGHLLAIRGQRKKRLLVKLPDVIAASVIVEPEFIEIIK